MRQPLTCSVHERSADAWRRATRRPARPTNFSPPLRSEDAGFFDPRQRTLTPKTAHQHGLPMVFNLRTRKTTLEFRVIPIYGFVSWGVIFLALVILFFVLSRRWTRSIPRPSRPGKKAPSQPVGFRALSGSLSSSPPFIHWHCYWRFQRPRSTAVVLRHRARRGLGGNRCAKENRKRQGRYRRCHRYGHCADQ